MVAPTHVILSRKTLNGYIIVVVVITHGDVLMLNTSHPSPPHDTHTGKNKNNTIHSSEACKGRGRVSPSTEWKCTSLPIELQ